MNDAQIKSSLERAGYTVTTNLFDGGFAWTISEPKRSRNIVRVSVEWGDDALDSVVNAMIRGNGSVFGSLFVPTDLLVAYQTMRKDVRNA